MEWSQEMHLAIEKFNDNGLLRSLSVDCTNDWTHPWSAEQTECFIIAELFCDRKNTIN